VYHEAKVAQTPSTSHSAHVWLIFFCDAAPPMGGGASGKQRSVGASNDFCALPVSTRMSGHCLLFCSCHEQASTRLFHLQGLVWLQWRKPRHVLSHCHRLCMHIFLQNMYVPTHMIMTFASVYFFAKRFPHVNQPRAFHKQHCTLSPPNVKHKYCDLSAALHSYLAILTGLLQSCSGRVTHASIFTLAQGFQPSISF
jgi:hypothetical protein